MRPIEGGSQRQSIRRQFSRSAFDEPRPDGPRLQRSKLERTKLSTPAQHATYNTPASAETNGVARISLIHGDVSTQRGDSKDWSAAALNAPVLAGDRVSTGDKARTELEIDYANTLGSPSIRKPTLPAHALANQIQLDTAWELHRLKASDADAESIRPT